MSGTDSQYFFNSEFLFFPCGSHVISDMVNFSVSFSYPTQFRCEGLGINNTVFFGKQDPVRSSHGFEGLHRFQTHRPAANDQTFYVFKTK